jgi:hypothetical protein
MAPVALNLLARNDPLSDEIRQRIEQHRPSRLPELPSGLRDRIGASHVAGKYHLGSSPFLHEGAEKLLALGTRVGKFWFTPSGISASYPFRSDWAKYQNFVELSRSPYFQQLFDLPFSTIILEAHSPVEEGWQHPAQPDRFYEAVTREFQDLAAHLYRTCATRSVTFVLQHWEGDWMLRGGGGETWNPPPHDWRERCRAMARWLRARQAGVAKARAQFAADSKCLVAHAAEVNRVVDAERNIPTVTREVLPEVELDLVSYSCYDGMRDPLTLWKSIDEIRQHVKPSPLFRRQHVYIGEIGIPENDQPDKLTERWDQLMGACLAADVRYVVQWELYCNETKTNAAPHSDDPVIDPRSLRGFWLVKPDGSLSETGRYFVQLWERSR